MVVSCERRETDYTKGETKQIKNPLWNAEYLFYGKLDKKPRSSPRHDPA
jgi:hypothetical protein